MPMYGTQLWYLGDILTDKFYIAMCVVYPEIWTEKKVLLKIDFVYVTRISNQKKMPNIKYPL